MKNIFRLMVVVLSFLLMIAPVSGQNSESRRLEPATADEFIETIPEIINEVVQHYQNTSQVKSAYDIRGDIVPALSDEFWLRYSDDVSLDQLSEAYERLDYGWNAFAFYSPYLNPIRWQQRALESWLMDVHPTLSDGDEYNTGIGIVHVSEYHISDSEIPDILLDTSIFINQQWLAKENSDSLTGYELTPLSIPYTGENYSWSQVHGSPLILDQIEDITGDGLVEFVYTQWNSVPSSGTYASFHTYRIYSWSEKENNLELILHSEIIDDDEKPWSLQNIDNDNALEVIQHVQYVDNFQCVRIETTTFDYQNGTYVEIEQQSDFAGTINCDVRSGQEAMQVSDYNRAIHNFQQARIRFNAMDDTGQALTRGFFDYATERLIIAYALNGELDEASDLIIEMNQVEQPQQTIAYELNQALEDGIDTVEICQTAYETLGSIEDAIRVNYRDIPQVGYINEVFYADTITTGIFSLENAGCNVSQLADSILLNQQFPVSENPVTQIEANGFTIDSTFNADFNGDGWDDWIIWIVGKTQSYQFFSDETHYNIQIADNISGISRPTLDWINLYPVEIVPLDQTAIATFSNYDPIDCSPGIAINADDSGTYQVNIWVYNQAEEKLVPIFGGRLCYEEMLPDTLTFNEVLTVWYKSWIDTEDQVSSSTRVWNPEGYYYESIPTELSEDVRDIPIYLMRGSIYFQHDYQTALAQINEWIDMSEGEERANLLYYRGLAYQMMGQDDTALADYIAVYEGFPNTVWAYLAELQLSQSGAN